ncbi:multiple epidermal growth factor-like domains protein 6 [Lingula anatina]|uniref:Multiple epidermal growth factor-like domains protein 6 n=1 Tax=Lingula anatina TaxID=7574 RepID=A0A1S3HHE7_LINAN|nr:multiple epidermal growth factor-like domains protein 6 [Lingula anatina]|eukprot:XP_013384434.1 multiple epidermal growth factor-like domains protein 6 [Lingula anatina]
MAATRRSLLMLILLQQLGDVHTLTGHVCTQQRSMSFVIYQKVSKQGGVYCDSHSFLSCQRYRYGTVYLTVTTYNTQYYQVEFCCAGWARIGSTCNTPICSRGCVHGSCTAPNVCTCTSGYSGTRCDADINECSTGNGGCTHTCTNTVGSFFCTCRTGFVLDGNGLTCSDRDECSTSHHGCEQKCNNLQGKYYCSCNEGYVLAADKKLCNDVDECSKGTQACDHNCHNTRGSYTCSCRNGYELASDGHGCIDVDECSKGTHACDHNCYNTRGSYTCSCRNGYELASDGRGCIIIGQHLDAAIDAAAPVDQSTAVAVGFIIGSTFAIIVPVVLIAISVFFVCRRSRNKGRRPATERSSAPAVTQVQDYDNVAYENAEVLTASKQRTEKNSDGRQHTGPWTVQTGTTNALNPDQPYEGMMIRDVQEQRPYSQLIIRGDVPIPTDI